MRRAGCAVPSVVTVASCAGGASALIAESSLSRTPEMIRTVAVAWTETAGGLLTEGAAAEIVAATSQSIA